MLPSMSPKDFCGIGEHRVDSHNNCNNMWGIQMVSRQLRTRRLVYYGPGFYMFLL